MSGIDLVVLGVILVSALISFVRGAVKEAVSLATWVLAIWVTVRFSARFATLLPRDTVESPAARAGISAVVLFLGCLLIGSLVGYLVKKMTEGGSMSLIDRLLGIGFGTARGIVIIALLVLAANLTPSIRQETWWRASWLLPRFQLVAAKIHERLPPDIGQHFDFTPVSS